MFRNIDSKYERRIGVAYEVGRYIIAKRRGVSLPGISYTSDEAQGAKALVDPRPIQRRIIEDIALAGWAAATYYRCTERPIAKPEFYLQAVLGAGRAGWRRTRIASGSDLAELESGIGVLTLLGALPRLWLIAREIEREKRAFGRLCIALEDRGFLNSSVLHAMYIGRDVTDEEWTANTIEPNEPSLVTIR